MKPVIYTSLVWLISFSSLQAQNLYNQSNAANIENESNTTTGWSGVANIASVTENPQHGTWCLRVTSNSNGNRHVIYTLQAVAGTTYNISIWARRGSNNSNSAFSNWTGWQNFSATDISSQSWTQYTFTLTASSNSPTIRVYASTGGPAGRTAYIDAISVTAQTGGGGGGGGGDTEPPTAPANLASSNVTTSSLTLSWNASTDNTGVTNYRIYRNNTYFNQTGSTATNFNVTGLSASTTYSFFVRAEDAAGNISPNSNTINVTTASGGGGGGSGEPYTTENANLPTVNWQSQNLYVAGVMGIFTQPNSAYLLSVNGDIRTKDLVVQPGWSDFVFDSDYNLPTLKEVEEFIIKNGRLIDIPSAAEVEANGIKLGEMNALLLLKVEELTLYLIELDKKLKSLQKGVEISY